MLSASAPSDAAPQVKQLEGDILTAVAFLPRALLTASKVGHVKL